MKHMALLTSQYLTRLNDFLSCPPLSLYFKTMFRGISFQKNYHGDKIFEIDADNVEQFIRIRSLNNFSPN